MPLPDSVLVSNYLKGQTKGTVQTGDKTDLLQLGQTRKKTLQISLDGKKTSASSVNVRLFNRTWGSARTIRK